MPIPSQLKTKIDGRLGLLLTHLEARQDAYFTAHGRYFQGIKTHTVLPKGEIDEETPPDRTRKPTDQAEDWNGAGIILPAKMPFALAMDVYDGPRGKGWSARVEVEHQGREFARRVGFGPDATQYTHDWQEVTDEGLEG
ncbi:MAG: hypothetical protein RX317_03120 [bacterium]|nr:hypothetical protein [bacterium]